MTGKALIFLLVNGGNTSYTVALLFKNPDNVFTSQYTNKRFYTLNLRKKLHFILAYVF